MAKQTDRNLDWYWGVALLVGIVIFIGVWIYSITQWGFLIGITIGWLPAIIAGFIGGILWGLLAILFVGWIILLVFLSR